MKKYDWIAAIEQNIYGFKLVGLWPKSDDGYERNLYLFYAVVMIFVFGAIHCICQLWKLFTNLDDPEVVIGTAFLSISETLVVLKMLCLALNIKTAKKLMITLNSDLFQPRNTEQIVLVSPSLNFWKLMYKILGICITIDVLFWAMVPIMTGSVRTHTLPFIASYPYNTKATPLYEITYFHQVASIFFMAYANQNLDTFIAAFSVYAGAQIDILCDNLKNICPENFQKELTQCVQHHREIVSFVEAYNDAFNLIIFIQFFTSALSLGLTMFFLTIITPFSGEFYSFTFYANAIILEIFIYCWFGNELQFKSSQIYVAAFESNWVEASIEAQYDLIFFLMRTQRFIKISALHLFDLSIENFLKILKTAYSYYTLVSGVSFDENKVNT